MKKYKTIHENAVLINPPKEGKVLTVKEVMEGRSSKYEFIDFDKQETVEDSLYDYGWCKGNVILPKEEPKQETLEEALNIITKDLLPQHKITFGEGAEFGAKWQQEKMYSEEEVINVFFLGRESLNKSLITQEEALDIIKNFKKK